MDETTKTEEARRPTYSAWLPSPVRYDTRLTASAKLLYAEISALTDSCGYCWASNDYFERLFGISERTVIRLLQSLAGREYIVIVGGQTTRRRIYCGMNPQALARELEERARDAAGGASPSPTDNNGHTTAKNGSREKNGRTTAKIVRGTDKNGSAIYNVENRSNIPPKPPRGRRAKAACEYEPELFERFWQAYPRGEDKSGARYEWDELKPDRELMKTMSAALDRQKATDEWRRGVGIPYACRWLRYHRWEDEVKDIPVRERASGADAPRGGRKDLVQL